MKIILAIMEYDYGDPKRGRSYEYYNFYASLKEMGVDVEIFDYMSLLQKHGKAGMNQLLLEKAKSQSPNIILFSLYTDQFDPNIILSLQNHTRTICFFHDDTWRKDFSRYWAKHFNVFTTPDIYGIRKYQKLGLQHAFHFPFGANLDLYKKEDSDKILDVSFVGAFHPYRSWLINRLKKVGINVQAYGSGWPNGMVSLERMIDIFNTSKINLNLSNSSNWDARYLCSSPRALVSRFRSPKTIEQLKARHFEISSTGSFQLSYYVEGLEHYYEIGKEIAIYSDPDDFVEKVQMYLEDEPLRNEIAHNGYMRTKTSHSFALRFQSLFSYVASIDAHFIASE
ncbi:CgeB family protein [Chromobacterium haemolyticum]|uniref:CgeB family protein n=1 Tax=Chromobacterium haemolyticum TaxID=394935 RepID=UPI0015F2CD3D|nr:glycosyltransferase [Chromobacterium haemolyticum]